MEWWDKVMYSMRRVRIAVAKRLGIRKSGMCEFSLLDQDVRTCEYEDIQVMWEMLMRTRTETGLIRSSSSSSSPAAKKRNSKISQWATHATYLCSTF